jgi:hypothetical protein
MSVWWCLSKSKFSARASATFAFMVGVILPLAGIASDPGFYPDGG